MRERLIVSQEKVLNQKKHYIFGLLLIHKYAELRYIYYTFRVKISIHVVINVITTAMVGIFQTVF